MDHFDLRFSWLCVGDMKPRGILSQPRVESGTCVCVRDPLIPPVRVTPPHGGGEVVFLRAHTHRRIGLACHGVERSHLGVLCVRAQPPTTPYAWPQEAARIGRGNSCAHKNILRTVRSIIGHDITPFVLVLFVSPCDGLCDVLRARTPNDCLQFTAASEAVLWRL